MSKGSNRRPGNGYEENYQKIFGDKKAETSFKRFGSRDREPKSGIYVISDIEPFQSPVTGEMITTRSQLKQHNKEHGVTNSQDYSAEYFERKTAERERAINGRTEQDRIDRINILRERLN